MKKNSTLVFRYSILILLLLSNVIDTNAQEWNNGRKKHRHNAPEFRTYNGEGNNPYFESFGATDIRLLREWFSPGIQRWINTPSNYADKISEPWGNGSSSDKLPSPRLVTNKLCHQGFNMMNRKNFSNFVWAWGQFLDHDIDLTEDGTGENFNIKIPEDDEIFLHCRGAYEMNTTRSVYDESTGNSRKNPREQINVITAFIDASQVYGSSEETANSLRTMSEGLMKTSNDGKLLPYYGGMFQAGDIRANENIALTSLHTLFLREHNRLAKYIAAHYADELPDGASEKDERIYQMARAIVGAEMQIITFKEFLPKILGYSSPSPYQYYSYRVDPSISNVFSTAAFRFGHSMIPPVLMRRDSNNQPIEQGDVRLKDAFFNPNLIRQEGGIEPILRGLCIKRAQDVDLKIVSDLRSFLFGNNGQSFIGFDLGARNIQRGRDHGLPSYQDCRRAYTGEKVHHFRHITNDYQAAKLMEEVYGHVKNVDLWVGGLAEPAYRGGIVGKTFYYIIRDQFERLRDGDRFWYTSVNWRKLGFHDYNPVIHSKRNSLFRIKLADIIKWNCPDIGYIDPWYAKGEMEVFANISYKDGLGHINLEINGYDYSTHIIKWYNDGNLMDNTGTTAMLTPGEYAVEVTYQGKKANYGMTVLDLSCPPSQARIAAGTETEEVISIREQLVQQPIHEVILEQNAPNPFSSNTEIRYSIPENVNEIHLIIYNAQGAEVQRISNLQKGEGSVNFTNSQLTKGIYFYTLVVEGKMTQVKRMLIN
ncbi:peroxidase family protein [Limibacter armeniacum]|uniref:peroxidase family protein n=1 Tax=Limibacter armeniacum TaxID=466084 RepID=UPI002FE6B8FA